VLLVVIPLSSDHNYPLCTASLHVHTFGGEDPTTGNSPSFSCVRRCKCPPHKPKTDCLTRLQALFRPLLYTFLMYTSPCTTRCYTRSCLQATDLIFLLNVQAATCCSRNGALRSMRRAGRRNIHIPPCMGMSLILEICETETVIVIACSVANTGRHYICSAN